MSTSNKFAPVAENVELLLAEIRQMKASGPHFWILHRFRRPGTHCASGEEVVAVFLIYRGRAYRLKLSLAQSLLFDYLAQHRHLAQSASQIAAGIHADPFYQKHGYNGLRNADLTRKICRSFVRQYIRRIHLALGVVFNEAVVTTELTTVLVSESFGPHEVSYTLRATCSWIHLDHYNCSKGG